jgi:hypothetical protein
MSYQNRQNFEPSIATRNAWYRTRKQTTGYGSTFLPGLFGTNVSSMDTVWFVMAMIIELVAVVITLWLGMMKPGFTTAIGATIAVSLFIVLDYAGILFHTHLSADRTLWKNQVLIPLTPQRLAWLNESLGKRTLKEDMGVVFLFLSGLLKVSSIVLLGGSVFQNKLVIALICIFYLIVIYIHAYHTGFWLASFSFKRKVKDDYSQWSAGKGNVAQKYVHNFQTPYNLLMAVGEVKNVNCQTLSCISYSNGLYNFQLTSTGLIWDQDIATMCMGLLFQEQPVLALECLQLQLTQTNASGGQSQSSSNAASNVSTSVSGN